jgi:dihydroflavonol-4-reductase
MALVLVTGATGLVGNNVVRLLLDRENSVRVLVRDGSDPRPLDGLNVDTLHGDIRDTAAICSACEGVSTVIHCAAHVHIGWTDLELQREINVHGTVQVADAARQAGARLIHVSSVDALGLGTRDHPADEETPLTRSVPCPYVITKREAESEVLQRVAEGLDAVIVNPGYMLGPWDWKPSSGRMLLGVARGGTFISPRGVNAVCDVRDIADGILAAVERGKTGRRYILSGESLSYLELWRIMADVTGARRPICRSGPLFMLAVGAWGDLRTRFTGREGDVNSASVAMSSLARYYSSARAEAELGYRSRPPHESVADAWDWFQRYGYVK